MNQHEWHEHHDDHVPTGGQGHHGRRSGHSDHNDVSVIGAGPSGLVAAVSLASAGRRVTLYERKSIDDDRAAGAWRILDNWTRDRLALHVLRERGVDTDFDAVPIRDITVIGPDSERVRYSSVTPVAYVVPADGDRSLDRALRRQALAVGVRMRFGREICRSSASTVIVATGPATVDGLVRGASFRTEAGDGVTVFLDDRIAPRGLGLLVVFDGLAMLSTHMFDPFTDSLSCLRTLWVRARSEVGLTLDGEPQAFGYPVSYSVPERWSDGRRLLVGAAGGFQDALLGAGAMLAMESAWLAADAVRSEYSYDTACRETLLPRLRAGLTNRLLFSQLGNMGYSTLLSRYADIDPLNGLRELFTPAPWRDSVLSVAAGRLHPFRDERSCHGNTCDCIRCRHGSAEDLSHLAGCFADKADA